MKQKPKHVNFIGAMLARGQWKNMQMDSKDQLHGRGNGAFVYIAPVFDSGQMGETWQSLHLDYDMAESRFEVIAAAADVDFRKELADPEMDFSEKEQLILALQGTVKENCQDLLLTDLCGRYFYLMIRFYSYGEGEVVLRSAAMEFPRNSFLEYFPEIYRQGSGFFERYISIFQTMYLGLEKEVDALVDRLDYEKAEGSDLEELAEWAGLDRIWIREAVRDGKMDRLRRLIANTNTIQAGRGTAAALKLLFEIIYDRKVKVLEYHHWHELLKTDPELLLLYNRLYGDHNGIAVFLDDEKEIPVPDQRERMNEVICSVLPLGMKAKMILLEDNSHMDSHCYLDKNSYLAVPEGLQTDNSRLYGNLILG